MKLEYCLEELETGGFMAYCPTMKPVIVQGETEDIIKEKLQTATKIYLARHPTALDTLKTAELSTA